MDGLVWTIDMMAKGFPEHKRDWCTPLIRISMETHPCLEPRYTEIISKGIQEIIEELEDRLGGVPIVFVPKEKSDDFPG